MFSIEMICLDLGHRIRVATGRHHANAKDHEGCCLI